MFSKGLKDSLRVRWVMQRLCKGMMGYQEGSRRFKKFQEGSRRFKKVQEGSNRFKKV